MVVPSPCRTVRRGSDLVRKAMLFLLTSNSSELSDLAGRLPNDAGDPED